MLCPLFLKAAGHSMALTKQRCDGLARRRKRKRVEVADIIYEAIDSFVAKCEAEAELEKKIIKFPTFTKEVAVDGSLIPFPVSKTADNLSASGWSLGCISAVDSNGRLIWIADAHRGDGQRFVVHADEKLTAFLELESAIR